MKAELLFHDRDHHHPFEDVAGKMKLHQHGLLHDTSRDSTDKGQSPTRPLVAMKGIFSATPRLHPALFARLHYKDDSEGSSLPSHPKIMTLVGHNNGGMNALTRGFS